MMIDEGSVLLLLVLLSLAFALFMVYSSGKYFARTNIYRRGGLYVAFDT